METYLVYTFHDVAKALDANASVSLAILDFSKAFDKVPHLRLLK